MGKNELRKGMLVSLEKIGMIERKKTEKAMQENLFASSLWKNAEMIGITLSTGNEWDTKAIIEKAWVEGKRVCVPKSIHASRALHFYEITSFKQLEKGYYNLIEPIVNKTKRVEAIGIDLMIVPGLIFTRKGYRIGFGGGFYDRFLKDFPHTTVSLLHSNQLVESFPVESFDIPVQYLITEVGLMRAEKV
ncbi:5-formyltetrahydrofolate cyclo-ligase [Alkalibacterium kapii]|uniref:5-formyltetrahydrofolate cyclo-ligase n=1 Tax=Alkalibacterium kapii TaxID=426704 RepID=A0A511AWD1_9LACT|nr:5-formyltetrahydrofolate cyclo-ligase [Alkalibacterium kapii]GEK91952.1 5-formyltetrahydrofolate cyclo-ligase [Alkalibacterium kapii]